MSEQRIVLDLNDINSEEKSYLEKLDVLLSQSLDFHDQNSNYASHNFHSFPAKFPPQLPKIFIQELTQPGDMVLDPMMGSGTTILEAYLSGRNCVGFDIDPLAILLSKTKVTSLEPDLILREKNRILNSAKMELLDNPKNLEAEVLSRFNQKSHEFINYWFTAQTQLELLSLIKNINKITNPQIRAFFRLAFSSIIITKTGGVSLAFDLAHTRPHKAKAVIDHTGKSISNPTGNNETTERTRFFTKKIRSVFDEFDKRVQQNLKGLVNYQDHKNQPLLFKNFEEEIINKIVPGIAMANAQYLPVQDNSIDLIITSPPYASNAIDYMRAHKFSLVWFGHPIDELGNKRKEYIGGESLASVPMEPLPKKTQSIVSQLTTINKKKGGVLHRYYSEMTRVLFEMYRVLKPGKAAIIVVGNSEMKGFDTEIHNCLSEIARSIGFQVPRIGVRNIDRNRRMMPIGKTPDLESQIQQRMHVEYILGCYKPQS